MDVYNFVRVSMQSSRINGTNMARKSKVYAVAKGRKTGIFSTWEECKQSVHKFTGAKFKSFNTRDLAENYLLAASSPVAATNSNDNISTKRKAETKAVDPVLSSKNTSSVIENPYRKKIKSEICPADSSFLKVHIMFDGGARGNPGIAGAGAMVVISTPSTDNETRHIRYYVGNNATNNVAEYSGLLYGLFMAKQMIQARKERSGQLIVQGDSNLIIQQLNGTFKVKNANLKPLFRRVQDTLATLKDLGIKNQVFEHVYRSGNQVADGTSTYCQFTNSQQ